MAKCADSYHPNQSLDREQASMFFRIDGARKQLDKVKSDPRAWKLRMSMEAQAKGLAG